jgi:prepilin-type N-terminal cleavage/methylation domain-containing protein
MIANFVLFLLEKERKKLVIWLWVFYTIRQKFILGGIMRKGFTLIEMLVVVLIIGILSSVGLPYYKKSVERSRTAEALTNGKAFQDAMNRSINEIPNLKAGMVSNKNLLDIRLNKGTWNSEGTILTTKDFSYDISNREYVKVTRTINGGNSYELMFYTTLSSQDGTRTCQGFGELAEEICMALRSSGFSVM